MLTKDLVRFRIHKGKIKPAFLDPEDVAVGTVAADLIDLFAQAQGTPRHALESACEEVVTGYPEDAIVARGLIKLLNDRSEFAAPEDEVAMGFRETLFTAGAQALRAEVFDAPETYYRHLEASLGRPIAAVQEALYADLPAFHPLTAFRSLSPVDLVHQYNRALVQWMLLHADQLKVTLTAPTQARLRQLLKALRFNQLLARITQKGRSFTLTVDGPMGLFGAARKYGMQLATFFPVLLHQETWTLEAEVKPKNKAALLVLDQDSGLKPKHTRFTAYVPEELKQFQGSFAAKAGGWSVDDTPDLLALPGETYCFPDFQLTHASGLKLSLELFHPWHKAHLPKRLQQLADRKGVPLLLGVSRKLVRDKELGPVLKQSSYYADWGFEFNDLPTTRALLPLLAKCLERQTS